MPTRRHPELHALLQRAEVLIEQSAALSKKLRETLEQAKRLSDNAPDESPAKLARRKR
jgi:hypothetical protein